jgi:hypothetical protein
MQRTLSTLAAFATAATLFSATSAFAQNGAAYRLVPATAVTAASTVIASETLWKCNDAGCTASKATSRPAIVCAQAAKEVGKLTSFTAKGVAFTADELAKCNEKAR